MPTKKYPSLKGTIFIVTYGRSGSTLLQSLLQTIDGARISGENAGALHQIFEAGRAIRKSKKVWGRRPKPKDHPWYGIDLINPDKFEKRLSNVFMEEIIKPPSNARWFGFKEIRYPQLGDDFEEFLAFCQNNFPNPFFVFNSRKAEDVANSKWWAKQPKEQVLRMIKTMDERFDRFAMDNPLHSHHVRFEETISDPTSLRALFEKLGEPFDDALAATILQKKLVH